MVDEVDFLGASSEAHVSQVEILTAIPSDTGFWMHSGHDSALERGRRLAGVAGVGQSVRACVPEETKETATASPSLLRKEAEVTGRRSARSSAYR